MMQGYFYQTADWLQQEMGGGEVFTAFLDGENSDYCRFNHNRVRQAGHVAQMILALQLILGAKHVKADVTLSGEPGEDRLRLRSTLAQLRGRIGHSPDDPHLLYATEVMSSEFRRTSPLPNAAAMAAQIMDVCEGRDMVGILASGSMFRGFANSFGQRNWFEAESFHFDWSFYHSTDKAVKANYAGFVWSPDELARRVAKANLELTALQHAPKTIVPGAYRVYLAPRALHEVLDTLAWGGFGLKSHRTRQSPLIKLADGEKTLHAELTLRENLASGMTPGFDEAGFTCPDRVPLIEAGQFAGHLVSGRSAKEYGVTPNCASGGEKPVALDLAAGTLPVADVLARLGTGIYVNDLWYLNFSDRSAGRMTGMTRFATFWVEDGEVVAPINVMRFDESVYRMLGDHLEGLTVEREELFEKHTYGARTTGGAVLPGALVANFSLTL